MFSGTSFYTRAGWLSLLVLGWPGCSEAGAGASDGGPSPHADAGDTGHHGHGEGGTQDSGQHCAFLELSGEACDAAVLGASASSDDGAYTAEVLHAPEDGLRGGEHDNSLMVRIVDAAGNPVSGAVLDGVFTLMHGGHATCGATPTAAMMDDGRYHVSHLSYPHRGFWVHSFLLPEGTLVNLNLCVLGHR